MKSIVEYKDKVAGRYVPIKPDQIGQKIIESDYYLASIKHDGYFGVLEVGGGKPTLYARNGQRLEVPAILGEAGKVARQAVLAGEICCFSGGHSGHNFEVKPALIEPSRHDLRFGIFDLLELDGQPPPLDPRKRYEAICSLFGKDGPVFCIEQREYGSRKDLAAFYQESVQQYEGIVVRASNGVVYKVKPAITMDLVVLGYAEAAGERSGLLRELLLGVATDDGLFQVVTHCGNGFSEVDREDIVKALAPMAVASEYTEVSGAKTAFVMIKPVHAAEISCLDLINETTQGPIRRSLLAFDAGAGYRIHGSRNIVSVISPVFLRLRADKTVGVADTGLAQFSQYLAPLDEEAGSEEALQASTVVHREVYIKPGKGGTGVRKIAALKTNKEGTGLYTPYVVVYTDYSAGRKTPLEQEVHLCRNEQEALDRASGLREENIKKGWEPAGAGETPPGMLDGGNGKPLDSAGDPQAKPKQKKSKKT